jgi:HEAT repeat protein
MQTKYLSSEERIKGQKYFIRFQGLNGLNFSFLANTVVYLLALNFDASNVQLGYLSSTVHFAGLILPFIPILLGGKSISTIMRVAWFIRGFVCLLYFPLLFISNNRSGVLLIIVTYTLFCLIRAVGSSTLQPMQKSIVTPQGLNDYIVRMFSRFHSMQLVSQIVNFIVLSVKVLGGLIGLLVLEGIGIICNVFAALQIKHIPSREKLSVGKGRISLIKAARNLNKYQRQGILLRWMSFLIFIMLGFVVPFLRRSAGLAPNLIFVYSIVSTAAVMIALRLVKPFIDRIGIKPLLFFAALVVATCFVIWGILPAGLPIYWFFLLAVFTNGAAVIIFMLSSRTLLRGSPEDNRMEYSALVNFSSAIVSLLGGLLGGVLANHSRDLQVLWINEYGLTFFSGAVIALAVGLIGLFLKERGSLSVRDSAQVLFSVRNLRAYFDVYHYSSEENPDKKRILLHTISKNRNRIVSDEISRILNNPLNSEKREVMRALFNNPVDDLHPQVLKEAANSNSYTREEAVFALGAYPGPKTEQVLVSFLKDNDIRIRSIAAKSLGRVGFRDRQVVELLSAELDRKDVPILAFLNFSIALYHMDEEGRFFARSFSYPLKDQAVQSYFSLLAALCSFDPSLAELYEQENSTEGLGFRLLIAGTRELLPFLEDQDTLKAWIAAKKYAEIHEWCRKILSARPLQGKWMFLKEAVTSVPDIEVNKDRAMALLYFTFQLSVLSFRE